MHAHMLNMLLLLLLLCQARKTAAEGDVERAKAALEAGKTVHITMPPSMQAKRHTNRVVLIWASKCMLPYSQCSTWAASKDHDRAGGL